MSPVPIVRGKKLTKPIRLKILHKAVEILSTPGAWKQGADRTPTSRGGYKGYCFCLRGAVNQATAEVLGINYHEVVDRGDVYHSNPFNRVISGISLQQLAIDKGFKDGVIQLNDARSSKARKALGLGVTGVLNFLQEKIQLETSK